MQKSIYIFWLMGLLALLPQCAPGQKHAKHMVVKKTTKKGRRGRRITLKTEEYRARIDGVECPLCAQSAATIVKSLDGVVDASYYKGQQGYEDGFLLITWDTKKGTISQELIEAVMQKEEFVLEELEKAASLVGMRLNA